MSLPTTGITASLVGNTLGTSARNVSSLCTNSNINKWAKYKPVKNRSSVYTNYMSSTESWPNPNNGSSTNYRWYLGRPQYKTVNGNSILEVGGLQIPIQHGLGNYWGYVKSVVDGYNTNGLNWNYVTVANDSDFSFPFRLGDFRGYDHNAYPTVSYWVKTPVYSGDGERAMASIYWSSEGTNLGLEDLELLNTYSPCAIIYKNSSYYTTMIGNEIIGDGGVGSGENMSANLSSGNYTVYFALIDQAAEKIIPLPNSASERNPQTFTVTSISNPSNNPVTNGSIQVEWYKFAPYLTYSNPLYINPNMDNDYGSGSVSIADYGRAALSFIFKNTTNNSITLNKSDLEVYWLMCGTNGKPYFRIYLDTNKNYDISAITVPANGSVIVWFSFEDVFMDTMGNSWRPSEGEDFFVDSMEFRYKSNYITSIQFLYRFTTNYYGRYYNGTYFY